MLTDPLINQLTDIRGQSKVTLPIRTVDPRRRGKVNYRDALQPNLAVFDCPTGPSLFPFLQNEKIIGKRERMKREIGNEKKR